MPRRAKIVCTLGPASSSPDRVRDLVRAGMDVARLNLSHGSHEEHRQAVQRVRDAAQATGRSVGVLVDLQGPKIRLGTFAAGSVTLLPRERFTITAEPVEGDAHRASTTYQGLPGDVAPGQRILVDDGRVVLEVDEVVGPQVRTRVVVGGSVSNHKGLNVPGAALTVPALTPKDEQDLRFAVEVGADLLALSFVRGPEDVKAVHAVLDDLGVALPVLAKLEKPQAVARLDEIVEAFDGLMVARGDLGVELPLEDVPLVQKRAVTRARERSKPTIVATQVLESMVTAPRPTRAEVSDCANAVLDGADAIMLSAETSVGAYPVEAAATMARIIETAEHELERLPRLTTPPAAGAWRRSCSRRGEHRRDDPPGRLGAARAGPRRAGRPRRRGRGHAAGRGRHDELRPGAPHRRRLTGRARPPCAGRCIRVARGASALTGAAAAGTGRPG